MAEPPDLVCVGRIVREMIHFPHEVKGPVLGSPPAYCSVAAARQGTSTGVVSKIGPLTTPALLQPLYTANVDTRGIIAGDRDTLSELIYDGDGNKEIRYPQMSNPITAVDVPPHYHGCGVLYICPMDTDVPLSSLADTVVLGGMSAVDLGGYGGVHMSRQSRQITPSLRQLAMDVASHFDIVKASDEDAASIFGRDDPVQSSRCLLEGGAQIVVITLGKEGALVHTTEETFHVQPLPGQVVDTTGGGDTFMAGFLSEYLRSRDPIQATRWGCATAICVIEHTGGVRYERMPTLHQVQERVATYFHR